HRVLLTGMIVWVVAILCLMTGTLTRVSSMTVFVLSMSFANINENIDNAGDTVRGILLFYLAISRCGAAWSVDACLRRALGGAPPAVRLLFDWVSGAGTVTARPVYIHPWPLRLILLQMVVIYWANGLHKIVGSDWQRGNSLYYVLGDATLTRWSKA